MCAARCQLGSIAGTSIDPCGVQKGCSRARFVSCFARRVLVWTRQGRCAEFASVFCLVLVLCFRPGVRVARVGVLGEVWRPCVF